MKPVVKIKRPINEKHLEKLKFEDNIDIYLVPDVNKYLDKINIKYSKFLIIESLYAEGFTE